ncbi:MAG: hypothetical protein A2655_03630 [Candidatus Yanofskybacteria bacterium RIFCSPHIGHO2_01_FULL_43_42]|uniref:Uncharacterized protein n=1 Tax=Candidatus Yanofskybacteria bacterium RIFCSPLOWO2_01_FULL_43_22 TaxID=1802695 RepID=A0A1F8GG22_9BACT|nr:MAG: hypothetical protein A2655_03630 [Candidatus Yanofskybacteria bacterium RIFCSPHIGHO2_01_FULL_43_42]OGN12929.1 MAG: hypothetical protein A3D48_03385 [Candidatus Yanofskybacteria bacterium RIFCSPHIGHO2_02_FULL_43_17]OGN23990.1 MAG: hypothetical protein A3A13_02870 [Candidatus Yanofskybacteria bacterium RIFCSPLOWO2_01_FULL_43_22]
MIRADIFIRFFGSFLIQNCGSDFSYFWPLPPKAAKWVRTISRILCQMGSVKFASPPDGGSATKS